MKKLLLILFLISNITFTNENYYKLNIPYGIEISEGKTVKFYENSDVEEITDLFDGAYKYTFANGEREMGRYLNGKREGKYLYIFSNGEKVEGKYINGEKEGEYIRYYKDGRKEIGYHTPKNDYKLKEDINKNYELKPEIDNSKNEGEDEEYEDLVNGIFREIGVKKNGKRNGNYEYDSVIGYHEIGNNVNDLRNGEYKFVFNPYFSGIGYYIVEKGTYINGKREGKYETYFYVKEKVENKKLEDLFNFEGFDGNVEKGTYVNDHKEGEYVIYNKNKEVKRGMYINGVPKKNYKFCLNYFNPKKRIICINE